MPAGEGWGEGTVPECLDAETLTAYSEGQLAGSSAAGAEHHLLACATCTTEVQRLVQLRLAIGTVARAAPATETTANLRRRWLGLALTIRDSARRFLTQPLPAFGALAATAVLLVVVTRFIPFGGSDEDVRYRGHQAGAEVELIADDVPARARPGDDQTLVATLSRGTTAARLEERDGWTRIELSDGRRVWVSSGNLAQRNREPEEGVE